ncbi:phytoene/squalene synthase family protein [Paenibacillus roseipurpureus]|uniref:Phytoene/squalene synthase family protein n=1 Tax=Paenibacillus roseopurpureus TaxID=2918901 RepID=A0AA96LN32_9BACL|nr:phytoene/squalene synthase family protein [Paenibacillus sp. MBLB1832]WNR44157.1 phytoene/squalene synthase family protein [Paenibacillus sp. MBLB1832]
MTMLKQTSRTFYIPISNLDTGLKEAVASAYLCMRAIDEIEDHEDLADTIKIKLLAGVHGAFQAPDITQAIRQLLMPYQAVLPDVSMRLDEWLVICPPTAMPIVKQYIAKMSLEMSEWVQNGWKIHTEEDLDRYTYSVAGMVGEMLSELWMWNDGTVTDREKAIAFGRGLQAVNILRNKEEDAQRGVSFYPDGWGFKEMQQYTRRNLQLADEYIADLKKGPALKFCKVPLALAHATVNLLGAGGNKLTRDMVLKIVSKVT